MAGAMCPCTVAVHFPPEVYQSAGASQVLPELAKVLDLPNVRAIQFVPNGVVRLTFKEPAQCDAVFTGGLSFRGVALRLTPVDARTRLVYVRDLPIEVPDDGLQAFLRPFGVVHSVVRQTYPGMPDVFSGTRVVKVSLSKDLPSAARISGFDVRFWYQGQPRACPVCRAFGHRVKDCPFNGKCRRCSQPGHVARECPSRRSTTVPASGEVSEDAVDDPDYVPSSASEPDPCSGDEEVLRSPPLSPVGRARRRVPPPAVESPSTPVSVPGTPESASAGPPLPLQRLLMFRTVRLSLPLLFLSTVRQSLPLPSSLFLRLGRRSLSLPFLRPGRRSPAWPLLPPSLLVHLRSGWLRVALVSQLRRLASWVSLSAPSLVL